MRIERISLKGLLRFAEVVTLDLRDVPPGLIAIVGANGEGKSTLLEAPIAALYRSFLSRDGELYDYAGDRRDSFLETEIAIDGRGTYRARVNIDGLKRTTDAVLEAIQPNGTRAMLNDGKASTFSAAVADHFPAKALLLASAFAAQNKAGSFVTLDKKNRKDLFSALLGLDHYQAMSDTARQAVALIDQTKARLTAVRDELARETADGLLAALEQQRQDVDRETVVADRTRTTLQAAIADLETRLALVSDQVAAYAAATQRVTTLEREAAARREERRRVDVDGHAADRQLEAELARVTTSRDRELQEIGNKIAGNERVREQADGIRAAVLAIAALDRQLEACRAQERTLTTRTADLSGQAAALDRQLAQLARVQDQRARAAADAGRLTDVPCGGAGDYAACQFLTSAAAARDSIPIFDAQLAERTTIQAQQSALTATRTDAETALATVRGTIERLTTERTGHQTLATYAEALTAAEARIAELQDKHHETVQRALTHETEAQHRHTTAIAALQTRAAELDGLIARLDGERAIAQAALEATATGNAQAVTLQAELAERRASWDAMTRTLARLEANRAELDRRRQELTDKRQRVADLQARVTHLETERLEWSLFVKAFSRDGLPVLEIDAAGPTISAYVNEILLACFGPRFTVDLITQRPSADGKKMVDDFSIKVFDNVLGGERDDITDLSGGEQVIVSEALRNAIAVYVNTRSPMPIRTCWRDETTGALDPENAARYMAMLRKVHQLGGFHHLLFISHNPDTCALADAQIRVHDGRADIVSAPFAEAA